MRQLIKKILKEQTGQDTNLSVRVVPKCNSSLNEEMKQKDLTPVITNRFVYHNSNPFFRDQIKEMGLIVKGKSETWLSDTPIEGDVIFATNSDEKSDWFDSTYDDDIYQIDTTKISNDWYEDPNFSSGSKHIITFNNIPRKAIKLIYQGTGNDLQENVDRDKRPNKIMKMIDKIGLYGTIKFFGGPKKFVDTYSGMNSISKENKIQFITDVVDKFLRESDLEGISLYEFEEPPILYYEDKNVIKQIEYLYLSVVGIDVYHKPSDSYMRTEDIPYEELSDETLNDVFLFVFELMEEDLS